MKRTRSQTKGFEIVENLVLSILSDVLKKAREELEEGDEPARKRKIKRVEGQRRLQELLDCDHDARIQAALRMSRDTFYRLRDWLIQNTNLRRSKHISVELKM